MIALHSINRAGTDYICGDIHGRFSLLETQLKNIGFDPTKDRLFSLGDLINRGNESESVLEWLEKPWFHAIQGNHERLFLQAFSISNGKVRKRSKIRGGEWTESLSDRQLTRIFEYINVLPVAIELDLVCGSKVGLVHAELPSRCDWNNVASILRQAKPEDVDRHPTIKGMLWDRSQARLPGAMLSRIEAVENISHVYHGHTILDDYRTIANRTFMDLGSYRTNKIGLLRADSFRYTSDSKIICLLKRFFSVFKCQRWDLI